MSRLRFSWRTITGATPMQEDKLSPSSERDTDPIRCASAPLIWKQVFTSLFTPSWGLGLILFVCLFLPSYEGCNGETVYMHKFLTVDELTTGTFYIQFILVWPYLLGLVISVGTLILVQNSKPNRALVLWWSFTVLIAAHAGCLVLAWINSPTTETESTEWRWADVWFAVCWLGTTAFLCLLVPITYRYSRDWFNAAMWLQLSLSVTATLCLSFVTPVLTLASRVLIGGKMAVACSVVLVVTTIVQRLDGARALTRASKESRLQLSLMAMLLLIPIAGMACAWAGSFAMFEAPVSIESEAAQETAPKAAPPGS